MNHKTVEEYVLSMPKAWLDYPFGEDIAVYKVFVPKKGSVALQADGVHGDNEKRMSRTNVTPSESRKQSTQQSAASSARVFGSAENQDTAVQGESKMFALIPEGKDPVRISLKCDPTLAKLLREQYETVVEGYHLNKKHWNTIILTGQLPWEEIQGLIRHSYDLVAGVDEPTPSFE